MFIISKFNILKNLIGLSRHFAYCRVATLLVTVGVLLIATTAHALPTEHYAASSVLAQGKWAKVKVSETGMQLITASDLRQLGFSNPEKVHVYGTGGRMVSEYLNNDSFDDLPLLPSVATQRGVVFFGTDNISWNGNSGRYSHAINPYCNDSYYFISDREVPTTELKKGGGGAGRTGVTVTDFMARILHEKDLFAPGQGGRMFLGEDFGVSPSHTFSFSLPGKKSTSVVYNVRFGAKTSGGGSSITVRTNGATLPPQFAIANRIPSDCDKDFIGVANVRNFMECEGDKFDFTIDFKSDGRVVTSRLDFIEIDYNRVLDISGGELYFYGEFQGASSLAISGASASTRIWDVTVPWDVREVQYEIVDGAACFGTENGYREYVAFDPEKVTRQVSRAGRVANQDLHSMVVPDMVIISPREYMEGAERIAQLHRKHDDMNVVVLEPQLIYNEFSGGHPDVMAFRKLLKMWHDRPGGERLGYCLLFGRGSYDNRLVTQGGRTLGYTPLPIWQSPTGVNLSEAFSTDDIIGMLDDSEQYSFNIDAAKINVAVGRLPVRSASEGVAIAGKLEKYMSAGREGSWRNRVMLIADDQDKALHLDQSETVYGIMTKNAPSLQYERVYLDSYKLINTAVGNTYPDAKERMKRLWNEGVLLTNYVGHGAPTSWTHEKLLAWSDITSATNQYPSFLYAATCSFGYWDADAQSGAELMVLQPKGGFIGAIVPSRSVFMGPNGTLNQLTAGYMFTCDEAGRNITVGDMIRKAKNLYNNDNKLRYCLLSDPALRLPVPQLKVKINTINGIAVDGTANWPELSALGEANLAGAVLAPDGSVDTDFNGVVDIELYDAEIPVETNGNGGDGEVRTYNDRKMRLCHIAVKVVNGVWGGKLQLPSEIENNYSPARIVCYAWSESGKEAHGSMEQLYVYGYDSKPTDSTGPEITGLRLNFNEYREGLIVNSSPVLHAALYDESGVNISESGIGHRMQVAIDGNEVRTDVGSYYAPDPDNSGGGFISYPLSGLTAGEHTLTLTVYDNVGNPSSRELIFAVGETMDPEVRSLTADRSPAKTGVTFSAQISTPNTNVKCAFEVIDLAGRSVWSSTVTDSADINGNLEGYWNLCDRGGRRVVRGIYLYRVYVETPEGRYTSRTEKIAVAAP